VQVKNTGSVAGGHAVQLYVSPPPNSAVTHPVRQLRAFAKARDLGPGASTMVELTLDKYAVSFWDETINAWKAEAGEYGVSVGSSSVELELKGNVKLETPFIWSGL
jgi:beta-glucosidase